MGISIESMHSMLEYKAKYFPRQDDLQTAIETMTPEEFGAWLAKQWGQAYRKILEEFLRSNKKKQKKK